MNLDPGLSKLQFIGTHRAFNNLTFGNRKNRFIAAALYVNVRHLVLSVVEVIHQNNNSIETGNNRHIYASSCAESRFNTAASSSLLISSISILLMISSANP